MILKHILKTVKNFNTFPATPEFSIIRTLHVVESNFCLLYIPYNIHKIAKIIVIIKNVQHSKYKYYEKQQYLFQALKMIKGRKRINRNSLLLFILSSKFHGKKKGAAFSRMCCLRFDVLVSSTRVTRLRTN